MSSRRNREEGYSWFGPQPGFRYKKRFQAPVILSHRGKTMDRKTIVKLFRQLEKQPQRAFPKPRDPVEAPMAQGVYVIRSPSGEVLHVGRTLRGSGGLWQPLHNH